MNFIKNAVKIKKRKKSIMTKILYFLAILCLLYCIGIVLSGAAGTRFYVIWLVIAAFIWGIGKTFDLKLWEKLPRWLTITGASCVLVGLCLFLFAEGLILSSFHAEGEKNLSYIVVLGAQMKKNGPSAALKLRLDKALEYLKENPDTICVVSGGKGANEHISEAEGMYMYLVEKGIEPERIIKEDESENTSENIAFSRKLIPEEIDRVGIVTSNFHVYRGTHLAESRGFDDAVGIAAKSSLYFLPNNMLREVFGIAKDVLKGNMRLW